jgi:hypothetical protein
VGQKGRFVDVVVGLDTAEKEIVIRAMAGRY